MPTLTPILSAAVFNSNVASNNSWINVSNDDNRPLFALATFNVNQDSASEVIADTVVHQANYTKVVTITSTIFSGLTGSVGYSSINGVTFPANFTIDSPVNAIKLVSGSVLAYK
jgi:selenophosphate synthase